MTDQLAALHDEVAALRATIKRLEDIEAIKQLRSAYFQCVDAQDWERWGREVLTENFRFEGDGGAQEGRDAVIASVSRALAKGQTVHHGHTPTITLTGPDTATGIWAMNDYVTMPHPVDATPMVLRGYGHYHDDYVRTPDGWRLERSRLVRLRVDSEGTPPPSR